MNKTLAKQETTPVFFLFTSLMIGYVVVYEPFCLINFVIPALRIGVEFLVLFVLMLLWITKIQPGFIPVNFFIFPLLAFWLLNAGSTLGTNVSGEHWFPGFITKIILLIMGVDALQYRPRIVKSLARAWALLWVLICFQVILGAVGYYLGLVDFPLLGGSDVNDEKYYFNRLFGYGNIRSYFGFTFNKVSGYLLEPIRLCLFLGLNILTASTLLPKQHATKFRVLNLIAGLFTGSVTFFLFFTSLAGYKLIKNNFFQKKGFSFFVLAIVGALVSWIILIKVGLGTDSSLDDRALRLAIGLNALANSTTHALWFGNINYAQTVEGADRSVSLGLLALLLTRGLIIFFLVIFLIYKYANHNSLIIAFLFYYSLLLDYFFLPSFIVYLILLYCLPSHESLPFPQKNIPKTDQPCQNQFNKLYGDTNESAIKNT